MNKTLGKRAIALCRGAIWLASLLGTVCHGQINQPTAVTLEASGTGGDALLNGLVNPNGLPTSAWFEWSMDGGSSNTTPVTALGSGTENLPFTATLSGLTAGVAYDYRVVASNSVGLATGSQAVFQLPRIILNGPNPMTNECHTPFADPGAASMAVPRAVAGGDSFSMALKYDGTVVAWGGSGNGETVISAGLSNVVAIAAGGFYGLELRADGTVFGSGGAVAGLSDVVAISVGESFYLALTGDGIVIAAGDDTYGQTDVPASLGNVMAVAAGAMHALALTSDGKVVGWGYNADGEINIPTNLSNVVAIAAGWNQSLALKSDGTVAGWGQTSIPVGLSNVVAIASGLFHNLALKSDGTVVGWGFDSYGQATGLETLTNVIAIAAGGYHSLAITGDGSLVAVGYNLYGQTSVPSNLGGNIIESGFVNYNNPGTYTLTYAASNTLGGAGAATRTVVVMDTTPPSLKLLGANPLFMPVNTPFIDPGATAFDACSGDLTGSIFVTGTVNNAVIGTNILTYSVADGSGNLTTTNRTVITMIGSPFVTTLSPSGSNHLATIYATIDPNGGPTRAWFEWGTNILHGNTTPPVAVGNGLTNITLSASLAGLTPGVSYHYRIVATNNAGRSTGRDVSFQNLPFPVPAPALMLSGANPLTNECHSPFTDPGAFVVAPVSMIAGGEYYSLALKTDGTAVTWGNASPVPPGVSNVTAVAAGYISSLALRTDGTVVGWGDNSFGETNTPAGLSNVVAITSGWGYSLALKADGTLVGWGENNYSPTVIPAGLSNVVAIAAGFDLCLAAKEDGTVVGWGHPSFGGTTPPAGLSNVVAVAAGFSYGLALKSDGTVVGWGTSVPAGLSNVVAIAGGFDFCLALKRDGTVVGWGDNFYGATTPPPGLKDVAAISAGAYQSLALKKDGTVVGWGFGFYGETDVTTSGTNLVTRVPVKGYVNTNDPGKYLLTYQATNAIGGTSRITRTVVVVDTTPPEIECPTNIIVGFSNENGARVFFAPKATDLCSSFVQVNCTPAPGSWFPIGTTTVKCKATDFSGNSATCSFQVTVLGAPGVISNLLSELVALSNVVTNQPASGELNNAISNLQQSVSATFWIDQTHLNTTSGVMVFVEDANAAQSLLRLVTYSRGTVTLQVWLKLLGQLVSTDYLLASAAVNDAIKVGVSPIKLNGAITAIARGNQATNEANYIEAIGDYYNAWSVATQLVNAQGHGRAYH